MLQPCCCVHLGRRCDRCRVSLVGESVREDLAYCIPAPLMASLSGNTLPSDSVMNEFSSVAEPTILEPRHCVFVRPHWIEAERSVLGGLLLAADSWDAIVASWMLHLYRPQHRMIFDRRRTDRPR